MTPPTHHMNDNAPFVLLYPHDVSTIPPVPLERLPSTILRLPAACHIYPPPSTTPCTARARVVRHHVQQRRIPTILAAAPRSLPRGTFRLLPFLVTVARRVSFCLFATCCLAAFACRHARARRLDTFYLPAVCILRVHHLVFFAAPPTWYVPHVCRTRVLLT